MYMYIMCLDLQMQILGVQNQTCRNLNKYLYNLIIDNKHCEMKIHRSRVFSH